jgi:hypothetical protein
LQKLNVDRLISRIRKFKRLFYRWLKFVLAAIPASDHFKLDAIMSSTSSRSRSTDSNSMSIRRHFNEIPNPPPPTSLHLWSQIVSAETPDHANQIDIVFRRRKPRNDSNNLNSFVPPHSYPSSSIFFY